MAKSIAKSKLGFLMFTLILAASLSILISTGMKEFFEVPRICEGLEGCPESFAVQSRRTASTGHCREGPRQNAMERVHPQ